MSEIKILVAVLIVWVLCLSVTCTCLNLRVTNVERENAKLTTLYMKMVEVAEEQKRVNEQTLHLLTDGGWETWKSQTE